jgi:hypothetical protein
MSYNNKPYYNIKPHKLSSELQARILKHISTTPNANYKTISKETGRDRITILQSLRPLIRHRYIRPEKLNPNQVKSKLVFRPTEKGIMYSTAYLGSDIYIIIEAHVKGDTLTDYRAFLQQVPDPQGRKSQAHLEAQVILNHDLFDENGDLIFRDREQYLKQGLRIKLFEQTSDKRFDIEELFKFPLDKIKTAHPTEVRVLRDLLVKIRNNLDAAILQLADR